MHVHHSQCCLPQANPIHATGTTIHHTRPLTPPPRHSSHPQAATCFPDDQVEAKKAMARWTVAFSRALRIHFQPEVTIESELSAILTPKELEMLQRSQHRPVRAIHAISQIIQTVPMSPIHQMQMSNNLTFFHDVLGGCERLLRAPIPVSYTR